MRGLYGSTQVDCACIIWAVALITAAFVAWVGFLQWRAAKRKAMLELNAQFASSAAIKQ
jgi:hypothetical protein